MMYNVKDEYVGRSLDTYGEFSELEFGLFRQLLQPGMAALDVGANIGAHTVGMAKLVGDKGQIVAFEPQRILYQMMCGNLALNNITNVMCLMAAAGEKLGSVTLPSIDYGKENNFGGVSLVDNSKASGETVPVLTIDSFEFPRCDFIKIDVEGMELEVLQGAAKTLARCKPFLYVENDRRHKSLPLITFLFEQGYRLYWHLPPLFNPDNFGGNAENIFGQLVSVNLLGIPKDLSVTMNDFVEVTPENASLHTDVFKQ